MKTKKQRGTKHKKNLTHHVRTVLRVTPKFVHGMVVGAFVGALVVASMRAITASALSISSPRDCDSNAVITCGALSTTELQQHYGDKGVAAIYSYVGISAQDIKDIGETAVAGRVYKNNTVTINGVVVATDAITGGREYINGSTTVNSGGVKFYMRPPSLSFRPDSLPAYVVMEKGQFKFAILPACGNFVKATAIPKEVPPPPPPPPPPIETPPPITTTVETPSTQTPPSAPVAPVAAAATSVAKLPNAGPGPITIIALLSVVGGYIFHATHRHIRHKRRLRHNASHYPHSP